MAQHRRSVFLINKKFQFRFAFFVSAWMIAMSFVYPLIVYNMFDYFIRLISRDPSGPPVQALQDLRSQILGLLIGFQALFLVVTFLASLFMSHRIAGPLYKLSRFFAMARDGDINDDLHFREKDHFQELAEDYNDAMKSVRARMDDAAADIERALPDASPGARAGLEKALTKLRGLQR